MDSLWYPQTLAEYKKNLFMHYYHFGSRVVHISQNLMATFLIKLDTKIIWKTVICTSTNVDPNLIL